MFWTLVKRCPHKCSQLLFRFTAYFKKRRLWIVPALGFFFILFYHPVQNKVGIFSTATLQCYCSNALGWADSNNIFFCLIFRHGRSLFSKDRGTRVQAGVSLLKTHRQSNNPTWHVMLICSTTIATKGTIILTTKTITILTGIIRIIDKRIPIPYYI